MGQFFAAVAVVAMLSLVFGFLISFRVSEQVYNEARRKALKDVIELARERQNVALYVAPEGELTVGLVRARAVHDVEMEVRDLLARVGKP